MVNNWVKKGKLKLSALNFPPAKSRALSKIQNKIYSWKKEAASFMHLSWSTSIKPPINNFLVNIIGCCGSLNCIQLDSFERVVLWIAYKLTYWYVCIGI